jgi:HAD superfamily hydrolase (TIGR01490 family)
MTHTGKTIVAAFDFDGTLTRHDTLLPFLRYFAGTKGFAATMIRLAPVLLVYALGMLRNDKAKESVLRRFFAGRPLAQVDAAGARFAASRLPALLRMTALARFDWHKRQGHTCVLVSASLAHYLEPWARQAGFDHVIASRLETDARGFITGRLVEGNCYGAEKARRLRALLAPKQPCTLYAYGDSRGDREMLALADHPYFRTMPKEHLTETIPSPSGRGPG